MREGWGGGYNSPVVRASVPAIHGCRDGRPSHLPPIPSHQVRGSYEDQYFDRSYCKTDFIVTLSEAKGLGL